MIFFRKIEKKLNSNFYKYIPPRAGNLFWSNLPSIQFLMRSFNSGVHLLYALSEARFRFGSIPLSEKMSDIDIG